MPRNYTRIPLVERLWPQVLKTDTCWLWQGCVNHCGYGMIGTGGKYGRARRVHRIVWEITHGPITTDQLVLHKCDVPACCNPAHLYLGDHARNSRDMAERGRSTLGDRNPSRLYPERVARGEARPMAKLTADAVREIRALRAEGATQISLARRLGVSRQSIGDVLNGKTWGHVA